MLSSIGHRDSLSLTTVYGFPLIPFQTVGNQREPLYSTSAWITLPRTERTHHVMRLFPLGDCCSILKRADSIQHWVTQVGLRYKMRLLKCISIWPSYCYDYGYGLQETYTFQHYHYHTYEIEYIIAVLGLVAYAMTKAQFSSSVAHWSLESDSAFGKCIVYPHGWKLFLNMSQHVSRTLHNKKKTQSTHCNVKNRKQNTRTICPPP